MTKTGVRTRIYEETSLPRLGGDQLSRELLEKPPGPGLTVDALLIGVDPAAAGVFLKETELAELDDAGPDDLVRIIGRKDGQTVGILEDVKAFVGPLLGFAGRPPAAK